MCPNPKFHFFFSLNFHTEPLDLSLLPCSLSPRPRAQPASLRREPGGGTQWDAVGLGGWHPRLLELPSSQGQQRPLLPVLSCTHSGSREQRDHSQCGQEMMRSDGERSGGREGTQAGRVPSERPPLLWWDICIVPSREESSQSLAEVGLKRSIQKTKIMASGPITSWQIDKQWKQRETLFWGAPKSLQMVTAAMKLKDTCSLEEKLWPT